MTAKSNCPKCGKAAKCYFREVGGCDRYTDEYTLICSTCGHKEQVQISGGSPLGQNNVTECPYCRVDCSFHKKLPREYW